MLYEDNPKYLGEVLSALVGEDMADKIRVTSRQQERKASSTPDGLILQPAVTVYMDDIVKGSVYICPAVGGVYTHKRCKYFGMYRRKRVERVALIEAVVDVEHAPTHANGVPTRVRFLLPGRSAQKSIWTPSLNSRGAMVCVGCNHVGPYC